MLAGNTLATVYKNSNSEFKEILTVPCRNVAMFLRTQVSHEVQRCLDTDAWKPCLSEFPDVRGRNAAVSMSACIASQRKPVLSVANFPALVEKARSAFNEERATGRY